MSDLAALREAEFIGWENYYSEGWKPVPLANKDEALVWVRASISRANG